jgi:hypothetical protein
MNLRLSPFKNSRSRRNKVAVGEFSWDKKFMVDKCDTCKSFRFYDIY